MPACPQCQKPLRELVRRCPSCQADLDLLVDYVHNLQAGLEKAERWTRSGNLGQAVWAYLEVLEVDPDNPTARMQVGQVVTAVRQFDQVSPKRRWLERLQNVLMDPQERRLMQLIRLILVAGFLFLAFSIGFLVGGMGPGATGDPEPKPPATLGGK